MSSHARADALRLCASVWCAFADGTHLQLYVLLDAPGLLRFTSKIIVRSLLPTDDAWMSFGLASCRWRTQEHSAACDNAPRCYLVGVLQGQSKEGMYHRWLVGVTWLVCWEIPPGAQSGVPLALEGCMQG